jgi:outer membrane protein TolC
LNIVYPIMESGAAGANDQLSQASHDEAIRTSQLLRPEIVELQLELAAAKSGITLARSQSQPNLVARGQLTEQTPSAFVHEHYASAMLEIKLPILDNDKTKLDTKEAEAQVKRLEALIDQAKSGAALDVDRASMHIGDARARLRAADTLVASTTAAYNVTTVAYSVGRATAVDVQSAMREVKLAKEKQTDAAIDLLSAGEDFQQAQGSVDLMIDRIAPLPVVQNHK